MTPPPRLDETAGTFLSMAALLALPELSLFSTSRVVADWLGPLCLAPQTVGDATTAGVNGEPAVRVTPEALRMSVVQDCMCRLVVPPPLLTPLPSTPSLPPPPAVAAAGAAAAAGATPALGGGGGCASVDSAGLSTSDSSGSTADAAASAATLSGEDWEAGASLGVDWAADALPPVGWDVWGSSSGSSSGIGSDFLRDTPEAAPPARSDAPVHPPSEWAAGAAVVAGLPEIPPPLPQAPPPPPTPAPPPRMEDDDGSGLGPVVAASSTIHVPVYAQDGVVCGVTWNDQVVDHLEELPGNFFPSATSRFVVHLATGCILSASTNGTRSIVANFGRRVADFFGKPNEDEHASPDCYALSWVRPATPGGEVLVTSRMTMATSALGDGALGVRSPPFPPPPASVPAPDADVEDLRRCFVSALTANEGTFGGGMAASSGVHADGVGPEPEILQVVTSTVPSSWVVAHRLRIAALSSSGGVHPARLVLPAGCGGDRQGSPPRGGVDRQRQQRRRLLPPPPLLAPRPGALPAPPPSSLAGGGGGGGGGCGGGRGGGKRARAPIDIDSVTDAVVRARVLRNRESARVSNARRKARAAAARAARQAGEKGRGGGGGAPPAMQVGVEAVGSPGGAPSVLPFVAPPALLLGGSGAR